MVTRRYNLLLSMVASVVIVLSACGENVLYEHIDRIPSATWNKDQILEFPVNVEDTLAPHHIYINIRNLNNYPLSNLFLFVSIHSPDGLYNRDTVQCFLAEPSGKWTGKGFGNIWSNRFRYKTNIRFPVPGVYLFQIEQAMRLDDLEGISDVGLRVERVN